MTESNKQAHEKLLQGIVDEFSAIQIGLKLIATDYVLLQRYLQSWQLAAEFDESTGELVDVTQKPPRDKSEKAFWELNSDVREPIVADHIRFSIDTIRRLSERLHKIVATRGSLLTKIDGLPVDLHELLSDIRGRRWRPFVSRYCLLPLEFWLKLPSRTEWHPNRSVHPIRPYFPTRVDWLLEYFGEADPTEHWKSICDIFDSCKDDIFVAAYEFSLKVVRHLDGPHGNNQWCHDGTVTARSLTNKPFKLAAYLWERIERRVTISDLIGKDRLFENVQDSTVQRHGSDITKFFLEESVPLNISSSDGEIWMERLKPKEK